MVNALKNMLLLSFTLPLTVPMTACGGAATQAQINELKAQIVELSKNYARLQVKVDNNSQRLAVLQDHPRQKNGVGDAPQVAGPRPPEHLQVVTIGPEQSSEAQIAEVSASQSDTTPLELLRKADILFSSKDYDAAEVQYLKFLSYFPKHKEAGTAQFKLGELYFERKDYRSAIQFYSDLIDQFPQAIVVPDGLYKKAVALEQLGEKNEANITLQQLIAKYPDTIAAKKGRVRLLQQTEKAGD